MGDALDDDQAFETYEMEPDVESGEEEVEMTTTETKSKKRKKGNDAGEPKGAESSQSKNKKKKKDDKGTTKSGGAAAAAEEEEEEDNEDDDEGDDDQEGEKKKKKKKKKKKPKPAPADPELGTAEAQSTYLWSRFVDLLDLSSLDTDTNRFPPSCFALGSVDGASKKKKQAKKPQQQQQQQQQSHNKKGGGGGKGDDNNVPADAQVTAFLQSAFPKLQTIASDKTQRLLGCPFVVVLSSSAVRANDLAKDLRIKLRNLKTAKLFAKHLKVSQQVEALQQDFFALAVGTPNRLAKLLETGALSLENCRLIVLDTTFKDSKAFDLLTLPGVAKDAALLLRDHVLPEMGKRGKKGGKAEEEKKEGKGQGKGKGKGGGDDLLRLALF